MKRIAILVGIVVVLILVIGLAIPLLIDANQFRPELQTRLGQTLGRQVTVGNLSLAVFSGSVTAKDLSIGEDPAFGQNPFLRATELNVAIDLIPLILSRQLNIAGITIQKPAIDLIQNAAGVWNFASLGGHSTPKATSPKAALDPAPTKSTLTGFSLADVRIADGRVTVQKLGGKAQPIAMEPVAFEMKNFSETSSFPFSLTASVPKGGSIKVNGTAGPINAGDVVATPFDAKLAASNLDLVASGLVDPSSGLGGVVSIDGSAKSQAANVTLQGKLKADQLKFAKGGNPAKPPVDVDFNVDHDLEKLAGTIRRADIHVGNALVTTTGTYRVQTEPATVALKVVGSNMPVTDLAALLPALDIMLPAGASIQGGMAQMNLACDGPLDKLVTTGTIALQNTKLANFDLATKLKVIEALAGARAEPQTTIQTFSTNLKSSPVGTELDNINLVVPAIGQMTGSGTISPSHELNFRMLVNVQSAALSSVSSLASKNGIPFRISGTSQDPKFVPDVKGLAAQEIKSLTGSAGPVGGLLDGLLGGKKKH